jgi:hypothetical protein
MGVGGRRVVVKEESGILWAHHRPKVFPREWLGRLWFVAGWLRDRLRLFRYTLNPET